MALTITNHPELTKSSIGSRYMVLADFALDSSYPLFGYVVPAALLALTTIERAILPSFQFRLVPYLLEWNYNLNSIRVFDGTGTEVPVGTNLSALSDIKATFIGV